MQQTNPLKKEIAVSGVVTDTQKQPVAGVVVTDGVNFTQTDDKGRYQLVSDPAQSKIRLSFCSGGLQN